MVLLKKKPSLCSYGKDAVNNSLAMGAVEALIISDSFSDDEQDEYEKKAEDISAEFYVVSTQTQEGIQFYNLGGIGAILRYELY